MSGNFNKVKIYKEKGIVIKSIPLESLNAPSILFQKNLKENYNGDLKICGIPEYVEGVENLSMKNNYVEVFYDYIEEKEWKFNEENAKLIGRSMAQIHNTSYMLKYDEVYKFPEKNKSMLYMHDWIPWISVIKHSVKTLKLAKESFVRRLEIIKTLSDFDDKQAKITLHRDFRKHNILFDGKEYHLIDFDFAAKDYVSIEVMSLISDMLDSDISVIKAFIDEYISTVNFPIIAENFVDDYLRYLCISTFPFYFVDSLPEENFMNLVNQRNKSLEGVYKNRKKLKELFENANIQR